MSRWLVVGIVLFAWPGLALAEPEKTLPEKLMAPIDFGGFDDTAMPLADGLEHLSKRYDVSFQVNEKAFRFEGVADVSKTPVADPRPVPVMPGARFKQVLQVILDRVPSGATYLVRDGYLEITTIEAARLEIYGPDYGGPYFPLVHPRGQERPLAELFDDVANQGPVNVTIDPKVREKLNAKVTLKVVNVPADTALKILSEMAGVQTVRLRNVFYVTTPERAAELRKEQAAEPKLTPPAGM